MDEGELVDLFPGLGTGAFEKTSNQTPRYNCVAWALGEDETFYFPRRQAPYHWPRNIPFSWDVDAIRALFRARGFEEHDSDDLEDGFDYVAVYADDDGLKHVARRVAAGWTSKLGRDEDIFHERLDQLEGEEYGAVVVLLRRPGQADGNP